MKITRERKIIGTILVLALAGFGIDRVTSGPESAAAAEEAGEPLLMASTNGTSDKAISNSELANADGQSLAERLTQLTSEQKAPNIAAMRDVFHPSASWIASQGVLSDGGATNDAARFVASHHLGAISLGGQTGSVAIIDGKLVHVGSKMDGFKLTAIASQSATFRNAAGACVQLALKNN